MTKKRTGPHLKEFSGSAHGLGKNILLCDHQAYITTFIVQMYANLSHDRLGCHHTGGRHPRSAIVQRDHIVKKKFLTTKR